MFQIEIINCLYMNAEGLPNKISELCELSNANNSHRIEISETRISQFTDQKLLIPSTSLFRNYRKTGVEG